MEDSLVVRVVVARGIIEYSDVTQPLLEPFKNAGTDSSTDAVQMTRVRPISMRTDPSACGINPAVIFIARN